MICPYTKDHQTHRHSDIKIVPTKTNLWQLRTNADNNDIFIRMNMFCYDKDEF